MTTKGILKETHRLEWKIQEFSSLSDGVQYSPQFSFAGEIWSLSIYPNGRRETNSGGFVGVFLTRESTGPPIKLDICFSFKTLDGNSDCERSDRNLCITSGRTLGPPRLISRSKLLERHSVLLPSDTLTVLCTLKYMEPDEDASDVHTSEFCAPSDNKVLQDLKELFLSHEDSDVVIKVKEEEFPAHRIILKARSPVLAATFRIDMKEKATNIVDIEDFEPACFSDFLHFLYCGNIEVVSEKNAFSLFTAADRYDVPDLRATCLAFMKNNLSVDTFCDTIALAENYSETELFKLTTEFFIKNAPEIILTEKWKSYLAENPVQSNELLIKLLVPDKNMSK